MTIQEPKKLETLKNLNDEFFQLYGDIYENRTFLTDKQKSLMQEVLLEQYKIEFEKIFYKTVQEDKFILFCLKKRAKKKIPWVFLWLFKNKVAKAIIKRLEKEAVDFRKDIENEVIDI